MTSGFVRHRRSKRAIATFSAFEADLLRYVVEKGSITVDGVSLTVVEALDPQIMVELSDGPGMDAIADLAIGNWFTPGFRDREPGTIERFHRMVASISPDGYVGCCAAPMAPSRSGRSTAARSPIATPSRIRARNGSPCRSAT